MAIATLSSRQAYPTSWGAYDVPDVSRNPEEFPNEPYYGPTTTQQFSYTPVAPPDPLEALYKQAFAQLNPPPQQPRGPVPYWENPATYYPPAPQVNPQLVKQAQEMIAQAMQYQGIRGYQRDLESGKSAAEAMSKWGPMLFAQDMRGLGSVVNAYSQGQGIPANPQLGLPAAFRGNVTIPRKTEGTHMPADQKSGRPAGWLDPNGGFHPYPQPPRQTGLMTPRAAWEALHDPIKSIGITPEERPVLERLAAQAIPDAPPAPVTAETAGTAPLRTMPKSGDVLKGYRFKGGDPSKKENWEKVQ